MDRIVAALPAGNPKLTDQRAFYVAISRARDAARLVTDDAHKLADQLERATGERLAALDATAKQAAWETVFGRDRDRERGGDHLTRASDAMDRGHEVARDGQGEHGRERHLDRRTGREVGREREREHRSARETGRDRDGKSPARSTERERSGKESTGKGHGLERDGERQAKVSRQSELEKVAEPKQKSRDFDLGM